MKVILDSLSIDLDKFTQAVDYDKPVYNARIRFVSDDYTSFSISIPQEKIAQIVALLASEINKSAVSLSEIMLGSLSDATNLLAEGSDSTNLTGEYDEKIV